MRLSIFLVITLLSGVNFTFCQEKVVAELPVIISESSGILVIGESFLSFNDSGGEPEIYVFNSLGKLTHTCRIENATNTDWEAITVDQNGFLYVGDFGNNSNKRKDLVIYKLTTADVLTKQSVKASKISFSYPDQQQYPPKDTRLYYDAEAFIVKNDSIFIFTKNRTKPFDGLVKVYGLSNKIGNQTLKPYSPIKLPATSWFENSVTDACLHKNTLFLLTYRYVYVLDFSTRTAKIIDTIEFNSATQKEGIYYTKGTIYLTDEKTFLGPSKLYKISYPL